MSDTSELIAQQIQNASVNKKNWGQVLYNVKVFGAQGDGVYNDTQYVQDAIDTAIANDATLVYFPPGSYKVTSLTNASSVSFVGTNAVFVGYSGIIYEFGTPNGTLNVKDFGAVGDGLADDTAAIQAAIDAAENAGGGTVYLPPGMYKTTSTIRIDSHYINLKGIGNKSKIVSAHTGDLLNITPPTTTVIPFFCTVSDLWLQGNPSSGHGIKVSYAFNVTLRDLYINGHGGDGVYGLHAMNCVLDTVRSDGNAKGFSLNQIDAGHRSTTCTLINCYFGSNTALGGLLSGGDSNVLIKCLFEGNSNTGLYITNGETNPNLHSCYFESNVSYSLNIDNAGAGQIFGGRFADENVTAHINLGNTTGWMIQGTWHATNSLGGTGININKGFAGGVDVVMGCFLGGATQLGGNAGSIKLMDNAGFLDRFKISTGDDIIVNVAGTGVIVKSPDGTQTGRIALNNSAQLTIAGVTIGRYQSATPISAIATGKVGDWAADSGFLYICHAANTWKRVAIATW